MRSQDRVRPVKGYNLYMKINYIYKINFVDGFYYIGSKKNSYPFSDKYYGSPVTHKEKWLTTPYYKEVIETYLDYEECLKAEKDLLQRYWGDPLSLNCNCAGSVIFTDNIREKLSKFQKGRTRSAETRKKISDSQKGSKNHRFGIPLSSKTRQKMSSSLIGKRSHFKGRKHKKETIDKIKRSLKGKPNPGGGWNKLNPEELEFRFNQVLKAGINLNEFGWVSKVSRLWGISHTQVRRIYGSYWSGPKPFSRRLREKF